MMNRIRKIACITGTRADYPRVKGVLKEIIKRKKLNLKLIVTGSHLLKEYGDSKQEIIDDGINVDYEVEMYINNFNTPYGMTKAAVRCADGIADALNELKPDLVLLTVDRVETLSSVLAASLMNFPIAHIQGGEVTGTIDESIRHAVTKMSHIHFPATSNAAQRIIKMGEDPNMVFNTGCPYIDIINNTKLKSKKYLAKKYCLDDEKPIIIFTQHAVTTEYDDTLSHIKITIDTLKEFKGYQIIAMYSNTDAGGREIINEINTCDNFKIIPNMLSADFISLMSVADLMVGNSSAGIREAPSFKLPVVNIGNRQQGRERAKNVIDSTHEKCEISKAIKIGLSRDFKESINTLENPYGDGNSSKRIVDVLETVDLKNDLIQKMIHI